MIRLAAAILFFLAPPPATASARVTVHAQIVSSASVAVTSGCAEATCEFCEHALAPVGVHLAGGEFVALRIGTETCFIAGEAYAAR